jgi:hypothetical protein
VSRHWASLPSFDQIPGLTYAGSPFNSLPVTVIGLPLGVVKAAGSIEVTDGTTDVTGVTKVKFTSGATVSNPGGGEADVAVSGGGGGASLTKITKSFYQRTILYDNTLGSDTASWDVSSIDQTYDHLELIVTLRDSVSGSGAGINITLSLNNDTTDSNYDQSQWYDNNGSFASNVLQNARQIFYSVGSDQNANMFTQAYAFIENYTGGHYKNVSSRSEGRQTIPFIERFYTWKNTAAINRITIQDNASGNLKTGSRLQIIGLKAEIVVTDVSGSNEPSICQGRLTLTTATPITTSDVTAATTIYFTPYLGSNVSTYNGTSWTTYAFTEKSLSLAGLTANTNYDIFIVDNTLALEAVAWTNDTTRATALVLQDGIYVKSGATTRRYLGTIRITGTTGQCEDSYLKRYVWNYYNRTRRMLKVIETTASWTYGSTTWGSLNGSTSNRVQFVVGLSEDPVYLFLGVSCDGSANSQNSSVGIGLDTTSSNSAEVTTAALRTGTITATYDNYPNIGFHYLQALQVTQSASTATFYGAISPEINSGAKGFING